MNARLKDRISMADYEERFGEIGGQEEEDARSLTEESSVDSELMGYLKEEEADAKSEAKKPGKSTARGGPGGGADDDKDSVYGSAFDLHRGKPSQGFAAPSQRRDATAAPKRLEAKPASSREDKEKAARFDKFKVEFDDEDF